MSRLYRRAGESAAAFVKRLRPTRVAPGINSQWICIRPDADEAPSTTSTTSNPDDTTTAPTTTTTTDANGGDASTASTAPAQPQQPQQPAVPQYVDMYGYPVSPLDACVAECQALLHRYSHMYNLYGPGRKPHIAEETKAGVVQALYASAVRHGQTSGKWLIFPGQYADEVWAKVAVATAGGDLGSFAKVAPCKDSAKSSTLICVYCSDFSDEADCRRVLEGLRDLGLTVTAGFKPDILTHLRLNAEELNRRLRLGPHWKLHNHMLRQVFPPAPTFAKVQGVNTAAPATVKVATVDASPAEVPATPDASIDPRR